MHYRLKCVECGEQFEDSQYGFLLSCTEHHRPAFLRAEYTNGDLSPRQSEPGIFRYRQWLPVRQSLAMAGSSVVFQSERLAAKLKLRNLIVIFNGFWPERGAFLESCTFKELEALSVIGRIPSDEQGSIVVSSAGNTGRAFFQACLRYGIPATIVVPQNAVGSIWMVDGTTKGGTGPVKLVAVSGNADYSDAIRTGSAISELPGFFAEGGARNVARRDGMGCAVLSAIEYAGAVPDHYIQAVGSGTGAVAAWEMATRAGAGGAMTLHLGQNAPFTPMTDAWSARERELAEIPPDDAKRQIRSIKAGVLSNREPPYSIAGGLYDALVATNGSMYSVRNDEVEYAAAMFLDAEGCDLDPAAAAAVATLMQAVESDRIGPNDVVALNITGGGYNRLMKERRIQQIEPDVVLAANEPVGETLADRLSVVEEFIA